MERIARGCGGACRLNSTEPQTRRRTLRIAAATVLLIAALALAFFAWRRNRVADSPGALLARLPVDNALLVGLDFDALRHAGVLQSLTAVRGSEDKEYRDFIRDTGFDYARDLHFALASFAPEGEFFLIRGSFDWDRLSRYAVAGGGSCEGRSCELPGSAPEKRISFFPLRNDLMAMAVAPVSRAAQRLAKASSTPDFAIPAAPVWLSLGPGALTQFRNGSGSSKLFASAFNGAERVGLQAVPGPNGGLSARLDATCRDAAAAAALAEKLKLFTALLKRTADADGKAAPNTELGGFLSTGSFAAAGNRVTGEWPISPALLASLLR